MTNGFFLIQYGTRMQYPISRINPFAAEESLGIRENRGHRRKKSFDNSMFLIAGVQPKTKQLDEVPRRCPNCGLNQAYTTRVDHYVSLFFIPLIRVKQGEPFLLCRHCQGPVNEIRTDASKDSDISSTVVCAACKREFDKAFNYCPHCGQRA